MWKDLQKRALQTIYRFVPCNGAYALSCATIFCIFFLYDIVSVLSLGILITA